MLPSDEAPLPTIKPVHAIALPLNATAIALVNNVTDHVFISSISVLESMWGEFSSFDYVFAVIVIYKAVERSLTRSVSYF
jgi:hypothetical protein